jgi:putative oxidoreductase
MPSEIGKDCGITVLRVMTGIVFLAHGQQKVFLYGLSGMQRAFAQMELPIPTILGPLVALLEFAGGIALVVGVLTRWLSVLFAIEMAVAVFRVHWSGGFFLPKGYEFALTMCGVSVALVLTGPGAVALDHVIFRRRR